MDKGQLLNRAAERGDLATVKVELSRTDQDMNVNWREAAGYWGGLQYAANAGHVDCVKELLADPRVDVNMISEAGNTAFLLACQWNRVEVVKVLLRDPRVDVNHSSVASKENTPLRWAAYNGHVEIIRWWIASGREMDLGTPGCETSDAIGEARKLGKMGAVTLLERFKENPGEARYRARRELGLIDELAAEVFATVVFICDGLLQVSQSTNGAPPAARFFWIATQLPLELQMVLGYRLVGSCKEVIQGKASEEAFRVLARTLH